MMTKLNSAAGQLTVIGPVLLPRTIMSHSALAAKLLTASVAFDGGFLLWSRDFGHKLRQVKERSDD